MYISMKQIKFLCAHIAVPIGTSDPFLVFTPDISIEEVDGLFPWVLKPLALLWEAARHKFKT